MAKMSRLSLIVKGKEVVQELFSFKTRKISYAVDAAISTAEENAILADMRAKTLLSKLGESYDDPKKLTATINEICETMDEAEEWKKKAAQSRRIKEMLAEEVDSESEE